ncbi:MAG: hypothetical protein IJ901_00710 [Bacteroidaceae bacterium]|nr:hypothetical protein [Bacteroidaceae bacterium]
MTKRYSDTTIPRHRRGEIHYAILLSFRNFPDFRIQDEHTLLEFTMSAKNANHAFRNFGKTESRRKCTDFFFYRQTFVCLFAVFSTKLYTCQIKTLHLAFQHLTTVGELCHCRGTAVLPPWENFTTEVALHCYLSDTALLPQQENFATAVAMQCYCGGGRTEIVTSFTGFTKQHIHVFCLSLIFMSPVSRVLHF